MPDLAGVKTAYFGFTGPIEPQGVTRLCSALNHAVNNEFDEVYLAFSSSGGYVADGIFLYNHIKALPLRVTIHNTGSVSSIAVAVFVAGAERVCSAHSMFMIHPTSFHGGQEGMTSERLQASLNAALADDIRTENILRERTALNDDILNARRFKDVHITPQDALKFGLVQRVGEFALPRGHQVIQV